MNAAQLERLQEHLQRLRLFKSRERLEALLQDATAKEALLCRLPRQRAHRRGRLQDRQERHHAHPAWPAFPFVKSLETFDFSYQPSLDKKQIQHAQPLPLHRARRERRDPRPAGRRQDPPGRRPRAQSHRARLPRVLFTTAAALIATLTKALTEGRLDDKLKVYTVPRLLIIDEIGYLPIDRAGANLFFQLISRRYERGPMILTSNQSFGAWGEVFGDRVIATAILDRVLHHAITINIRGNSYRLKDKLKAGLVRPEERRRQPNRGWGIFDDPNWGNLGDR